MPFAGCPNRCSFCDQHTITGCINSTTPEQVRESIEIALSSGGILPSESEIAFFGGSFTAIDRDYMISLLSVALEYTDRFKGIRISTRPDCIDEEVLGIIADYRVTAIELGAQSMNDEVLRLNHRGHDSDVVRRASQLIKAHGFSLGLQMMTGLYGSTDSIDIATAEEFIDINPDTVRIYPTVVLEGTELARLWSEGTYIPPDADSAADLCASLIPMFEDAGINIIRVGLHSSETMEQKIVAGAYHPAFRELCENRIFLNKTIDTLKQNYIREGEINVFVSPSQVSKLIGQKKSNLTVLHNMGYRVRVIPDTTLVHRQIRIEEG